jgi:hypothetical protein
VGTAWDGTRGAKRPAVLSDAAGEGSARRVPSSVCVGPQEVTEPGATNSGPVQNRSPRGAAPSGGVIAQLEKHDMDASEREGRTGA